jgi:hypothetical protein
MSMMPLPDAKLMGSDPVGFIWKLRPITISGKMKSKR